MTKQATVLPPPQDRFLQGHIMADLIYATSRLTIQLLQIAFLPLLSPASFRLRLPRLLLHLASRHLIFLIALISASSETRSVTRQPQPSHHIASSALSIIMLPVAPSSSSTAGLEALPGRRSAPSYPLLLLHGSAALLDPTQLTGNVILDLMMSSRFLSRRPECAAFHSTSMRSCSAFWRLRSSPRFPCSLLVGFLPCLQDVLLVNGTQATAFQMLWTAHHVG